MVLTVICNVVLMMFADLAVILISVAILTAVTGMVVAVAVRANVDANACSIVKGALS